MAHCLVYWLIVAVGTGEAQVSAEGRTTKRSEASDRLAEEISRQIESAWKEDQITPSERADDAEFLRRVYLDLVGRIPRVAEVRDFLEDKRADKRERLVDALLANPLYIQHFTVVWRKLLLPEANGNFFVRAQAPAFEGWLRTKIAAGAGYDEWVREILTAPLDMQAGRSRRRYQSDDGPTPIAFFQAKEGKPENIAASAARLFLGVRLECAQCHHHPFAEWKQGQFWSLAAFFAGVGAQNPESPIASFRESKERRSITIPDTGEVVEAAFLDGSKPEWSTTESSRDAFADWLTSSLNPYFPQAAANRVWAHLFGTGLVEPADDFRADNPPSHPKLLEALANGFADHDFDTKFLLRSIVLSRPYQLSSRKTHDSQTDARQFARMPVRGLSAEQLFDSLALATGYRPTRTTDPFAGMLVDPIRSEFLERFGDQTESTTEQSTSILQALLLMNGSFVASATNVYQSQTLGATAELPGLEPADRVDILFLATLARLPSNTERERYSTYVAQGGAVGDSNAALGDVFWALLNSAEFHSNH